MEPAPTYEFSEIGILLTFKIWLKIFQFDRAYTVIRAGSGGPEPRFRYSATGFWETSHDAPRMTISYPLRSFHSHVMHQ